MTETAGIFALTEPSDSSAERMNTQGKPYPGIRIRIVNPETKSDAALNEIGEILVRGYCLMEGYYRDPAKTAEAIDSDGWLHTGDLYQWTSDGSLIFKGRLKEMLKVGGENVAAIELETFLCDHPAVRIAVVIGMPDPRLEEVPVAFIELRNGTSLTSEALIDFCKGKISNYKIPREIYFMAPGEWPMSATKISKRALRDTLLQARQGTTQSLD